MEIVYLHILSVFLYIGLFIFSAVKRLKYDFTFILALSLTIFWLSQSVYNNYNSDSYYQNYYSVTLCLFGWMLFLQSTYLKIPNTRFMRLIPVIGINLFLIAVFAYQFRLDQATQSSYILPGSLYFSSFIICIALLFFLENIVRCLKANIRYSYKHLLFGLFILAFINLLNFYSLVVNHEVQPIFHFLSLLIHLVIPVFLYVSLQRKSRFEADNFNNNEVGQLQYFLILIGGVLVVSGLMQMFDVYFSQVRSDLYQSIFFTLLIFGLGMLLLSNTFRTELSLYLKSYFYGDRNDYKKEWDRVIAIIRHENKLFDNVRHYYQERFNAREAALYLYSDGLMKLQSSNKDTYPHNLENINDYINDNNHFLVNIYIDNRNTTDKQNLYVALNVEDDLVGICWLKLVADSIIVDDTSAQLCSTVSTEFAIRLWELNHKTVIQRRQKMATFNKTVTFLAHDLKNIVAQQQLALENYAKYHQDPEFMNDFNQTIQHSTDRLNALISQFRDSSLNTEKKRTKLDILMVNMKQKLRLLGDQVILRYSNPEDKNIDVDVDILTVIENLLKNAKEASANNEQIDLSIELDQDLKIEVADKGSGMTQEFINNQLFEPFNTTKESDGLGVGMYHVKTLSEKMNADIQIDSKIDHGTTVTLRIPVNS